MDPKDGVAKNSRQALSHCERDGEDGRTEAKDDIFERQSEQVLAQEWVIDTGR